MIVKLQTSRRFVSSSSTHRCVGVVAGEVDEPVGRGEGEDPEPGAGQHQQRGPPQQAPLQQDLLPVSHAEADN